MIDDQLSLFSVTRMFDYASRENTGSFHLFVVDHNISEFAQMLIGEELEAAGEDWGQMNVPSDARRHGQCTLIALPHIGHKDSFDLYAVDELEGEAAGSPKCVVGRLIPNQPTAPLGWFEPSKPIMVSERLIGTQGAFHAGVAVAMAAFVLSLINQPRIVSTPHLVSRQARRAAQRGGGIALDCMHRVTWDLSKDVVAKLSRDPNFHKMPLHWRRGHYRTAMSHWSGAIQRPDAVRESEREGWWQWIEGTWVGHPAFGIKRSVHAPKMSLGRLAK